MDIIQHTIINTNSTAPKFEFHFNICNIAILAKMPAIYIHVYVHIWGNFTFPSHKSNCSPPLLSANYRVHLSYSKLSVCTQKVAIPPKAERQSRPSKSRGLIVYIPCTASRFQQGTRAFCEGGRLGARSQISSNAHGHCVPKQRLSKLLELACTQIRGYVPNPMGFVCLEFTSEANGRLYRSRDRWRLGRPPARLPSSSDQT